MYVLLAIALCTSAASFEDAAVAEKSIDFIGFSSNERISAWHVTVRQPQAGGSHVDTYSLVRLVNTENSEVITTYRNNPIRRRSAGGRAVAVAPATLEADNPDWRAASPRSQWLRTKKRYQFSKVRLPIKDSTVRLLADDDTKVTMKGDKERKLIVVDGAVGSPVGFHPIARLMNGRLLPLGHFRSEGRDGQKLRAEVEVYHSRSGYHIAIVNRFKVADAGNAHILTEATVARTPGAPIGSTGIGLWRMINEHSRSIEDMFLEMHPSAADDYKTYVGDAID